MDAKIPAPGNTDAMTARLGRMVEDSLNEIYVFDAETLNFVQVNRGARENLGYSMEELQKITPLDIKPELTAEDFAEMMRPLREDTQEWVQFETVHRRRDGSDYNVEVRLQLMRTEQPHVYIAFVLDVTERVQTEEKLRQAMKMEAIGRLTGGVAHDFNNILTVVQGNLELLEEQMKDEKQCNLIRRAIGASERAAMLTHRLLAFARKQPLRPRTIDINHLLTSMTDMLRRSLGENIQVKTDFADSLWKTIIDPSELENAVLNLAVNARDAMKSGGTLTIATRNAVLDKEYAAEHEEVESGEYVLLSLTDTGDGIPDELLEKVFDPFFTTKEVGEGSGLGLSMVYGYVRQSGGHVKIHSREGEGTSIRIHLPRHAQAEERPAAGLPAQDSPRARGETVLVVEDNPEVRALAVSLLERLGYRVIEAEDGPTALKMIERSGYIDLIFTDVVLPNGLSGVTLAEAARRRRPGIKILFTTGYSEETVTRDAKWNDDAPLIQKPYSRATLAQTMRRVLEVN